MRLALLCALLLAPVVLSGCGSEDADEVRDRVEEVRKDVEERIEEAREEFEERRKRFGRRIRDVLDDLEKVFERPEETSPIVQTRGRTRPRAIERYLTRVLRNVDRYWTLMFASADLPEPRVRFHWVAPRRVARSGCGDLAGDFAAFYCPADDTIYIGQVFAAAVYRGALRGLPGESTGGRAAGDFAVAYVVAHEYAHNLQQELGVFDNSVGPTARPYELQADCMAGTWAYSVFAAGDLKPGDLEEASNAALAVGDFDVGNAQHHGTPDERRAALLAGFDTGDPAVCNRFLPT